MVPQTRTMRENSHAVGTRSGSTLAPRQIAMVVVLGVVFWFIAALVVRFGAPLGFFGPVTSIIAFGIGVPVCWLSVWFIIQVARLAPGQTVPGIALGLVAATACDGIALTWARWLYGTDPALITFGAAWILWGVGLFLLFAYLYDHRPAHDLR